MSRRSFLLYGYYGRGNVGDDAMLYGFLHEYISLFGSANFAVLRGVSSPKIPAEAVDNVVFVPSVHIEVLRWLVRCSAFLIAGGTHLSDYGQPRRSFAILTRILLLTSLAKLLRKEVYLLGIGLGPFRTHWGRLLAHIVCLQADGISVRDRDSVVCGQEMKLGNKMVHAFDMAVLMPLAEKQTSRNKQKVGDILGVSITPVHSIYFGKPELDLQMVDKLSTALQHWLDNHPGWRVRLFVFHADTEHNGNDDETITAGLSAMMNDPSAVSIVPYMSDPQEVLAKISECTAFVAMKYHASLLSYVAELPLLILAYHPKCESFANEIGLAKVAVVSLREILDGDAEIRLNMLAANPTDFIGTLEFAASRARARLALAPLNREV